MLTNSEIEEQYERLLADPRYSQLVVSVAKTYWRISSRCSAGKDYDEFYSAAMVGLWKALKKRDPEQGDSFLKYAKNKMSWQCADHLRVLVRRSRNGCPEDFPFENVADNRPESVQITEFLPDGDSRASLLKAYYLDGYTLKQISKLSGKPLENVKKQILSALQDTKEFMNGKLRCGSS